jgi:uracil phosphoribosyltransferase
LSCILFILFYSEEGLGHLQHLQQSTEVTTPTNLTIPTNIINTENIVVVSIIRAGDSLLDSFLKICPEAAVGKILIQRDEETALPIFIPNFQI